MQYAMIFLVLPFIIGMIGEVFKKLVLKGKMPSSGWPGWQGVYFVTFPIHALIAGAIFGAFMFYSEIPWPKDVFGSSRGSAVLAGTFAGGVAMVGYSAIVKTIKNMICLTSLKKNADSEEIS